MGKEVADLVNLLVLWQRLVVRMLRNLFFQRQRLQDPVVPLESYTIVRLKLRTSRRE